MISTGEDLPKGQSILARVLTVEVKREDVDIDRLTDAQKCADRLQHAMAGYIEWLVPKMDELAELLPKLREEFRQKAS